MEEFFTACRRLNQLEVAPRMIAVTPDGVIFWVERLQDRWVLYMLGRPNPAGSPELISRGTFPRLPPAGSAMGAAIAEQMDIQ